jgi:hypothetical protein
MCYFNFLNFILTKNLEILSSFLEFFYFKISQFFKNFKLNRLIFGEPTSFIGFHENQSVFIL